MKETITKIDTVHSFLDENNKRKHVKRIGIRMKVRGSKDIEFIEGSMTGDMEESGISINTQEHKGKLYGGCIDRKEVEELRDFLNRCIEGWE